MILHRFLLASTIDDCKPVSLLGPDGDEVYERSAKTNERAYRERRTDKHPVWIMGRDGSNPHVIESLHYQTTIDGSRVPWRPR